MNSLRSKGSIFKFYSYLPLIILLISVLNEFDFNYLNLEYFSFNFPFILIFYFNHYYLCFSDNLLFKFFCFWG